ncbi:recombinase family protein [Mesorhizobium sp.]|uniref:recombinase family protein n=1 Tax=Mesorhizobium sp. TaxID=1871066 RepID=UPI00257EC9E0|nr:recombinase family protein [Mesorhizobium sp.]
MAARRRHHATGRTRARQSGRSSGSCPSTTRLHHILINPIYAGAYAFGRTCSKVTIEAGRKRILRGIKRDRADWEVLLIDHHEGYLSWHDFERNQRLITDNATSKGLVPRGALRRGDPGHRDLLRAGW